MGLLDGALQAVFGEAFGGVYMDGTLHRATRTEAENGDVTVGFADEAVKVQKDAVTEAMRQHAGYTERDVRLLVLQIGAAGVVARPNADCEISVGGERWAVSSVASDPAGTYWECRCSPAQTTT